MGGSVDKTMNRRAGWRRLYRSPLAWTVVMTISAVVFAACGGGSSTSEGAGGGAEPAGDGSAATNTDKASAAPSSSEGVETAPDFELVVFGNENYARGELVRLSQFRGQPVVINFWFPSCPPCRAEMPDLEESFKRHRPDGVEFIGVQLVGLDTAADGQAFIDEIGTTYAVGPDEDAKITIDYGVTSFPTTVFLDKEHNVVREWGGILPAGKLEELVQETLSSQD